MEKLTRKRNMLNWAFDSALERGDLDKAGKYLAMLDSIEMAMRFTMRSVA